jgi:hypothetical protein
MAVSYPDSIVAFTDWVDDNPAMPGTGIDIKAATLNPRDDEIEAIQTALGPRPVALNTFAERKSATSGLQWAYHGGRVVGGNVVRTVADGYIALPDSATSYVYYDWDAAIVTSSTVGFPVRSFPIAEVTALNAQFTGDFATHDRRTIAIVSAVSGSSGGGGGDILRALFSGYQVDGVITEFTCGYPVVYTSLLVFLNGVLQYPNTHYTVTEGVGSVNVVVFNAAPEVGDTVYLSFQTRSI